MQFFWTFNAFVIVRINCNCISLLAVAAHSAFSVQWVTHWVVQLGGMIWQLYVFWFSHIESTEAKIWTLCQEGPTVLFVGHAVYSQTAAECHGQCSTQHHSIAYHCSHSTRNLSCYQEMHDHGWHYKSSKAPALGSGNTQTTIPSTKQQMTTTSLILIVELFDV